jgi:hypothetical protein
VAAGALAAAALGVVSAAPANAAVMVSGSLVDSAGNYAAGTVRAVSTTGATVGYYSTDNGAFDIPLEDGTYKLEFSSSDYASEWYRDKADLATADVVTVAGAAQTLAPWTVDRKPFVYGVVRTADGRPVESADVEAYDAATGNPVGSDDTQRDGVFRIPTAGAPVKLYFSGYDPSSFEPLADEWFNDKAGIDTADPVTPSAPGTDVGVVTLAPGGSISGRVTSEAGTPLYRARVCADGGGRTCDNTDGNGAYLIEGVSTGNHTVRFSDPIGEYVGEYWNNVPLTSSSPTTVTVAPGQAVTGVDAALAARPVTPLNGVDLSGTVRDQLGGLGVGYVVNAYDTPADARDKKVVATTITNRAGQYAFAELDRIGGETEFKIEVTELNDGYYRRADEPREEGDFARRTIWSGDRLGYETAAAVTAAPRTLDFVQPVAGGVSGAVTSEAGPGKPEGAYVSFRDADADAARTAGGTDFKLDGTYDIRTIWPGEYTVQFNATNHVSEWWKDTTADEATTITVRPGQMTTGISAALTKLVKAVERPEVAGDAWVGKTLRLDKGRWNTEGGTTFTYEWLIGTSTVVPGESLKVTKSMLGKKITGRVTNDAGFALGQAITASTAKVGYKPKVKAKVSKRSAAITLKAKPLKAKKVKATITVFEIVGVKKNGDDKMKKLGKGKIKKGTGVVRFKKALGTGKHKLVFTVKGKGKVGSGDIMKKVKLKR